ncbi:MAG TPA: hypothetical protein VM686_30165, partial [Polyangiaceae bacterium]|nr:hypothetical protein [Polyangiaceae bacterium]
MSRYTATFGPFLALVWVGLAFGQAATPSPSATAPTASAAPAGSASAGTMPGAVPPPPSAQPTTAASVPPPPEGEPAPPAPSAEPAPPEAVAAERQAKAPTPANVAPAAAAQPRPEADLPKREYDAWRDGHGLGIEGTFGFGARIGSFNDGFGDEEHFGTDLQLGLWLGLSSTWAFGLEYEHAGLGKATSSSGLNSVSVEYDVDYLWLGARAYFYRADSFDLFLNLRAGLGWQSLDATGTREQLPTTVGIDVFACSASAGPGFGLGAGFGAAYRASKNVLVHARVDGVGRQQS